MSVTFFKFKTAKVAAKPKFWDNQEIAEFYRAVDILKRAGLNTEVDSGVTDEGDPWFVFIRPETGEVIAHFARIDGHFIAVSSLNQEVNYAVEWHFYVVATAKTTRRANRERTAKTLSRGAAHYGSAFT